METIVLEANVRDVFGKKLAGVRKAGKLPAIVYGNKKDNQPLILDRQKFEKIFAVAGHNTILELKVDDGSTDNVLIHEVSLDPITNNASHVDFVCVDMNKTIRTEVPIHFVGESPAVFQNEGTLLKNLEEVEVETLPTKLPSHLEVDISILDDFSKTINVSDLKAPEGVKILTDPEAMICKVEPPRSEEEIAALDEEVGEAIPEGAAEEESAEGKEAVEEAPPESQNEAIKGGVAKEGTEK